MAKNPKKCPYFIGMRRQAITCKGVVSGMKTQLGYASAGQEKAHFVECCSNAYHRCPMAQTVNEVWHEFEIHVCPHNSGVECLHADECDHCGWNPVVADKRLISFLIGHNDAASDR